MWLTYGHMYQSILMKSCQVCIKTQWTFLLFLNIDNIRGACTASAHSVWTQNTLNPRGFGSRNILFLDVGKSFKMV